MADASIEFTLDTEYYAEFHKEWIDSVARGWRVDRVMVRIFGLGGAGLFVSGMLLSAFAIAGFGLLCCLFGALEFAKGKRKRAQWLSHVQSLPGSGRTMRIEVVDGVLVQKNEFAGDPRFARTGELLDSPNGYLLKYKSAPDGVVGGAISTTDASLYIPHRAIRPSMRRAQFRALLKKQQRR